MSVSLKEHTKRLTIVLLVIKIHYTKCHNVCVSEWRTGNIISLNCSVCNLAHDVSIYDPSSYPPKRTSKFFATCLADSQDKGTRKCKNQNATQDFTTHTTSFVIGDVATFNLYGIWTCRHGSEEGYLELKPFESKYFCTGDEPKFIGGSIFRTNKIITFTFSCHTCRRPIGNGILFLVDEVIENVIRGIGEECFNNQGLCINKECSCSSTKNTYQWVYRTNEPNHVFGVQLKLIDAHNGSIVRVHLKMTYNGKEFTAQEVHTETIKSGSEYLLSDAKNEKGIFSLLYVSIGLSVLLLVFYLLLHFYKRRPRRYSQTDEGEEMVGLLDSLETSVLMEHDSGLETCHTCRDFWPRDICVICKNEYCDICSDAHIKFYPEHNVLQKISTGISKSKCKSCEKNIASMICKDCKKPLCKVCANGHKSCIQDIEQPIQKSTSSSRTISISDHEDVVYVKKISIPEEKGVPVRICGISFLGNDYIIVADNNNNTIKIFKEEKLYFEEYLMDEPRGITGMTEKNVAITFAYNMQIRIYEIKEKVCSTIKTIDLPSFGLGNLKPFSISHNKNHFAIEAGEGDDGLILIIDVEGELKHKIENINDFAFFTGNTIRLALNMNKGRIYISGMSKKAVSCIDFKGNIIWNVPVPSPRSIIVIPEGNAFGYIICASKRGSGIFRLREEDGKDDIIEVDGNFIGSRYIAYHSQKRLLCIQVTMDHNTKPRSEELRIYKYNK